MDDSKTTPPDVPGGEPGWGERRRRPEPPPQPQPPPSASDEPRPSDPPPPHGDPLASGFYPGEDWGARHGAPPPPPPRGGLDFSALFVLLDALRRAAPTELQERMTAFIRM